MQILQITNRRFAHLRIQILCSKIWDLLHICNIFMFCNLQAAKWKFLRPPYSVPFRALCISRAKWLALYRKCEKSGMGTLLGAKMAKKCTFKSTQWLHFQKRFTVLGPEHRNLDKLQIFHGLVLGKSWILNFLFKKGLRAEFFIFRPFFQIWNLSHFWKLMRIFEKIWVTSF